ncbi:MAG: potassium transporter TrkG [Actinomycetota bacterium]|nr:potassium transporter TrkG [Actinomycetota bacterium]
MPLGRLGGIRIGHPSRAVTILFLVAITVGTCLLMLPVATAGPGGAPFLTAVFTSTSAICVTGLAVVDTPVYWTPFGQAMILVLIQLGGLGVMTLASMLTIFISHNLGLRQRLIALTETGTVELGDLRSILAGVIRITIAAELLFTIILTARFALGHGQPFGRALWLGTFHAISAWNNAGFALYSRSLANFESDPFILLPVAVAVIVGGIGFPVMFDLWTRRRRIGLWTLHTKLTLVGTAILLVGGWIVLGVFEWSNPATLGPMDVPGKLLNSFFSSTMTRTAGFNSIEIGSMTDPSILFQTLLMFIGGGSASTAGGIKVTTFAVLVLIVWAEARGDQDTIAFGRRISGSAQRQAVSITIVAMVAVFVATLVLLAVSPRPLKEDLFEAFSGFGTVGLSTGITPSLPALGQVLLMFLMFAGRLGPLTISAALVAQEHERLYRYPQERPLIG